MKNTLKLEFLSLSQNEALARAVAAAFIMPLDPTLEELADVRTAVSEAVTNAIVHGYGNKKGVVRMECRLDGRMLTVSVTDFGCGIEDIARARQPFFTTDEGGERSGMGFAVMEAFMDGVDVVSKRGAGTRVTLKKSFSEIGTLPICGGTSANEACAVQKREHDEGFSDCICGKKSQTETCSAAGAAEVVRIKPCAVKLRSI